MSSQTVIEVPLMAKHNPGHSLVSGHSLNIDNSLFLFFISCFDRFACSKFLHIVISPR